MKYIKIIFGIIICIISLPFLFIGMIGWFLLYSCSLNLIQDEHEDKYLSGTFRGFPKN